MPIIHKLKVADYLIGSLGPRFVLILGLIAFILLLVDGRPASAQSSTELLTNAVDVISLSAEQAARSGKVSVTGVVTASDPALKGRFFVQDATSGVFVDNVNGRQPAVGELVQVTGITYAGAYAPTITAPKVTKIGMTSLPLARPVTVEQLMSGAEDSQRIEISGIVRDAKVDGARLAIDLAAGGYRFRAYLTVPAQFQPEKLIGSQVLVRGTAAEAHNRSLRQLIIVEVYIPSRADLVVEKSELINPFEKPLIPLNKMAQFRRDNSLDQRVHVRGVVTLQKPGEYIFLQDASGGLQIQNRQSDVFTPGQVIEAVGFPNFENYLPVLQDAILQPTTEPPVVIRPKHATIEELQNGLHHAEYVSLAGKLIERIAKHGGHAKNTEAAIKTVLVLQGTNFTFTAEADDISSQPELGAIPIGSTIEVNGICLTEIDNDGKLKSFQILMRHPDDFKVLQKPSWFTPQRLLFGFLIICSVLIVIVSWSVILSRKNSVLNFLIREREKAQNELQQAHDQLEERIQQRTAELKFQITARKESEIQFKAILAERTRLAQELHDTVEQTLTGIALQLDTAAKLHDQNPPGSLSHLEIARKQMFRSQNEVRQSVWDLRRLVQEHFDLAGALLENARQMTRELGLRIELKTQGDVHALPEIIEENFLRISHEAFTNVIKHAGATQVNIRLEYAPAQVILRIQDNGRGFVPQNAVGPREGHFGLLGISERVKRLGGEFNLTSAPGQGTMLEVKVSLDIISEMHATALAGL